jgi:high-affinity iron transporter
LLGIVLLVMVGEQAQEMQLARWLPTTEIRWLTPFAPPWMGVWFSIFPTVETLSAQVIAGGLVLGSYLLAGRNRPGGRARSSVSRLSTSAESAYR